MQSLSEKLDKYLIDLAWSLWTELGVAGVKRNHQQFSISLEELILLTSVLADRDPRLRDEALDWCTRFHHFVSISRLKTLAKAFGHSVIESFSVFSATLNAVSQANWPLLIPASPLKFFPSGKSKMPQFELPALLSLRLRSLFGVGARADLLLFFLSKGKAEFSASDLVEIGYTKRNIADMLEGFVHAGIFNVSTVRNQQRYYFVKHDQMVKLITPIPEFMPSWRNIFEVILTLRTCIQQIENKSEGTKIVEIRNTLMKLEDKLLRLNLTRPPKHADFATYLNSFREWVLDIARVLSVGDFKF